MKSFKQKLLSGEIAGMIRETVKGEQIDNKEILYNVLKPYFAAGEQDREQFVCLFLDAKNKLIAMETMFVGTLCASYVYTREIIKKVFYHQAAAIIIAHNHPSGDSTPSNEDRAITKKIMLACRSVDVTLHEHIVVGGSTSYSFADSGEITRYKNAADLALEI